MKSLDFENEISIPQAKALLGRGTFLGDEIYLVDNISNNNLPQNFKKSKCLVFILCEEGQIRLEINGETIYAEKNDMILITSGQSISYFKTLSSHYRGKAIFIATSNIPFLAEHFCDTLTLKRMLIDTNKVTLNEEEMEYQRYNFSQIVSFVKKEHPHKQALAMCLIKPILFCALEKKNTTTNCHPQNKKEELFLRFEQIVNQRLLEHLQVSEYCNIIGISNSQLESLVYEFIGYKPIKYIQERLINRICIMLESTTPKSLPISEIAKRTHFSSASALSRFAKRMLHMSLTTYRHLEPAQQHRIIRRTILDQTAALKDLPKSDIQASQAPRLS